MKLVELLARELDAWPEEKMCATQDPNGTVFTWDNEPTHTYGNGKWYSPAGKDFNMKGTGIDSPACTDQHTAIITRADWQAERERIAGGWIAWGGGECPVADDGDGYDVKLSSGEVEPGPLPRWYHTGFRDIIAYRLHKPEQASVEAIDAGIAAADAGKVKPIEEVKAVYEYNQIHARNRIIEIDRTTEALEEERASLVQRLADEGFSLLQVVAQSEPAEDMSDWRNWSEGDMLVVEDNAPDTHEFKTGELVKFMHHDENHGESAPHCESNYDDWWVLAANLKFHSRPTA